MRPISIQRSVFVWLALSGVTAAWWGCSATPEGSTTGGNGGTTTTTTDTGGTGASGGVGGFGGGGGDKDGGACTAINEKADRVQLDIVFLIDRSMSMSEANKWPVTKTALTEFFNAPTSAKIGAGITYFPNDNAEPCVPEDYANLIVPIDTLPGNAFALTNSMPEDATGTSTPTYGGLKGALMAATAYQDAHPKHRVIVVLATDGGPNACGATTLNDIADLAKSARNYNGVLTYVIGAQGADIQSINKIAAAGGTTATYDITADINQFSEKMQEIRVNALGCDFELPAPPEGQELDPDEVNFSYTPGGVGESKIILRADDLADCNSAPGWYYDDPNTPTKIILCPASCTTVQNDDKAKIEVLFGCKTQVN